MAAIKKFFQKKKLDVKFKKAGEGHKLTEDTRSVPTVSSSSQPSAQRAVLSDEAQRAAQAALARVSQPKSGAGGSKGQMAAMRSQISQEMEAERKAADQARALAETYSAPKEVELEGAPMLTVSGVYYKCPLVGPIVLPRKEMEDHIYEFLLSQLAEEPEMTSALIIYTRNKDSEKVRVCVETLCKYLDNIINHPGDAKFQKIRLNNKAYQERIEPLEGTQEFLQSVGFEMKRLPGPNEVEEEFYVLSPEKAADVDRLKSLKDILTTAEPIKPELDRNVRVIAPSANAHRMNVPDEFYSISPEELKKEQQLRKEAVDKLGMLRTKEMRERERQRELRKYRYTLIRIRFPDGLLLQGTFRAQEKLKEVIEFARESIALEWVPFSLACQTGQKFTDENSTLAELDLAPAAVVNFAFDQTVLSEITAQQGSSKIDCYLKPDLMESVRAL